MQPDVVMSTGEIRALHELRHSVPVDDAVFWLEGPGVVPCLQGVLTNDVEKPGDDSLVWGAFLTPKGMIVTDAWVRRTNGGAWVVVPAEARETTSQLFQKSFPPRLVRVADRTGQIRITWLLGGAPGAVDKGDLARPNGAAPFTALVLSENGQDVTQQLADAGWTTAPPRFASVAKLLLGWPTLGRETDERTLPQEVRFDELGGVKYDKGCYTGQETVARVHFRGHTNRVLVGAAFAPGDEPAERAIVRSGKEIGTLRTVGRLGERTIALVSIRREIPIGDVVTAGNADAVLVELPFDPGELLVA